MHIEYFGEQSQTIYAVLRTTSGYVFNPSTFALDIPVSLDHSTYSIAMTEDGVATGRYAADPTCGSTATFICEYWRQEGGSPSRASDTRLGAATFYFDGDAEWPSESVSTIDDGTSTTTTGSDETTEILRIVRQLFNLRTKSGRLG